MRNMPLFDIVVQLQLNGNNALAPQKIALSSAHRFGNIQILIKVEKNKADEDFTCYIRYRQNWNISL